MKRRNNLSIQRKTIIAGLLVTGSFSCFAESWSIGLGSAAFQTPYQEINTEKMIFPTISYTGEKFNIGIFGATYNVIQKQHYSFSVNITPGEFFLDASKSSHVGIRNLKDRNFSLYLNSKVNIYGSWGAFSTSLEQDITDQSDGQRLISQYVYPIAVSNNVMFTPTVEATWLSAKVSDYYFGVKENESTFFPAYKVGPALNLTLGASVMYTVNSDWMLLLAARYSKLDNAINASPITESNKGSNLFLLANYKF